MNVKLEIVLVICLLGMGLAGCTSMPLDELRDEADIAMRRLTRRDKGIARYVNEAHAYVIFPKVGKGGVGIGAAYGQGVLFTEGQLEGYAKLKQATIGFQLGGQTYSEIIFFRHKDALSRFKSGSFTFSAQASAVAVSAGKAATADYEDDVLIFTMTTGGLMFEASIGGQKFEYTSKEVAENSPDWSDKDGEDWKDEKKPAADSADEPADKPATTAQDEGEKPKADPPPQK